MPKPDKTEHGKKPTNTVSINGSPDLLRRIDDWRRAQEELGPRSEAVKQLLNEALTAAGYPAKPEEETETPAVDATTSAVAY